MKASKETANILKKLQFDPASVKRYNTAPMLTQIPVLIFPGYWKLREGMCVFNNSL